VGREEKYQKSGSIVVYLTFYNGKEIRKFDGETERSTLEEFAVRYRRRYKIYTPDRRTGRIVKYSVRTQNNVRTRGGG